MIPAVGEVKSTSRRERARQTRLKIIRAAHEEFLKHGYHGATMAAIARGAGVATQTVYFVFHTKAELISAAIDAAVLGEDDPTAPEDTDWWVAMLAAPTGAEALEHFVRGAGSLYARAAGISEVLRAAALTDPDVHAICRHHDQQQVEGFRRVVDAVTRRARYAAASTRRQPPTSCSPSTATAPTCSSPPNVTGPTIRPSTGPARRCLSCSSSRAGELTHDIGLRRRCAHTRNWLGRGVR